ncbi:DUF1127 domain-containing protein [Roseovarius spongiae]|uniref:DUF1127 domain-containing protein n=1 Tax=Roseovarius spongiae TaxID=2320272 RepID=A0A3A8AWE1_9RHOB|nr:DUF1127 domain-containing protein [Roseovarius spongiae]RKF13934.1 DUF1127 domain-containing protein [Roseovarius spongiae]
MASFDATRTAPTASTSFGGFFTRAFGAIAAWNDARATRKALSQLSDRALEDIGLSRHDIARVTSRG